LVSKYRFIARRLLTLVPTVILAVTLIFLLMDVIPGDAALIILGQESAPESLKILREKLGLDRPLHERYIIWLGRVFSGNLGNTLRTGESINALIVERLPVTLSLASFSLLVAVLMAIPLGIVSALKRDTSVDLFVSMAAFVGVSIPGFWLGMILLLVLSVWLGLLPSGGFVSPFVNPLEWIKHIIMPSTTLGLILGAFIARLMRSSLLEVMMQDYIITARAKGLSERIVIYKHALKNALIPVVTVIGIQFAALFGGSVIAEEIFSISGMGRLMYYAVLDRDYLLVQGCALVIVFIFVISNLIVDLAYMYLDPRVRYD
jgi:peptide/nickel transport system permease protein